MSNKKPNTRRLREGAEKFSQQKPKPTIPRQRVKPPPAPKKSGK